MVLQEARRKVFLRRTSPATSLPSFFVVGPPRTGTTWLHGILKQSANLPSPTKETRFFDHHFQRGLSWYLAHFSARTTGVTGEVAPTYFYSEIARQRIARMVPSAKVICIFRNPVERILSLYRLKRAYGLLPSSFELALLNDPELVESGRYATHFKAWRQGFGKGQVLGLVYDDMRREPQTFVNTITEFVRIPPITLDAFALRPSHESEGLTHPRSYFVTRAAHGLADWCKTQRMDQVLAVIKRRNLLRSLLRGGRKFEPASPELIKRLYALFRSEVEELEIILDREFPTWKPKHLEAEFSVPA